MARECPRLLDPSTLPALESTARTAAARMQDEHGVNLGAIIIDTMSTATLFDDETDNAEGARIMNVLNRSFRARSNKAQKLTAGAVAAAEQSARQKTAPNDLRKRKWYYVDVRKEG
jgi:hypothetical protein